MVASLGNKILGIKIEIEGEEIFEANRPAIIIANHQSNLDAFIFSSFYPNRMVSVGKEVLKWIPFFGTFYWLSGNILINRSNKRKARESMNLAAKRIRKQGSSVLILPEGTRSKGKGLLPFKKGAYHLALAGELPIIPVSISSIHINNDLNKFRSGKVLVKVHQPVITEGKDKADINELLEETRNTIDEGIKALDRRLDKYPSIPSKQKPVLTN